MKKLFFLAGLLSACLAVMVTPSFAVGDIGSPPLFVTSLNVAGAHGLIQADLSQEPATLADRFLSGSARYFADGATNAEPGSSLAYADEAGRHCDNCHGRSAAKLEVGWRTS